MVKKVCARCEEVFEVDENDIPSWQQTFLCTVCEDHIERAMEMEAGNDQ